MDGRRIVVSHKEETASQRVRHIIPGLFVCIVIAIVSKIIGKYIPSLGAATISIFLGILVGNTIGRKDSLNRGTKFAESTLLSISVVLLGATLSVQKILEIGFSGLIYILLQMTITVFGVIVIGKKMKLDMDFTLLMASGNSVCGSSAIASTAPVLQAHSKDKGIAITMVNVTGTVLMIFLPFLTSILYKNELVKSSAMIGGILQSVGQVVAAGSIVSEDVKELATIYKIVRIVFLVVVVLVLAEVKNRSIKKGLEAVEEEIHSKTHKSRIKIPWYIIGFFIACILVTIGLIPTAWMTTIKNLDNFLEIIALTGIGMRVYIADLMKQGVKVSLYCLYTAIVQIISAIVLIAIFI